MNQPIRRRRRRLGDFEPLDLIISRTETEAKSPTESTDTKSENEHPPNTPQVSVDSTTNKQLTIDRIRSEIQEEQYHCQLNEPHYYNDSHDWGDNLEFVRARLLAFSPKV